jgi:L-amino acid N-acyltransferase YncA
VTGATKRGTVNATMPDMRSGDGEPARVVRELHGSTERAVNALVVRAMRDEDWPSVCAIYGEGIATGNATFETETPDYESWAAVHPVAHRLVATRGQRIVGWAALSPVSDRCAYAGVAEVSVYVAAEARGEHVGSALLARLVEHSATAGLWTLQAGIFPENIPSVQLHLRCGFRVVGTRERLGQLHGTWRDVLLLERRAPDAQA